MQHDNGNHPATTLQPHAAGPTPRVTAAFDQPSTDPAAVAAPTGDAIAAAPLSGGWLAAGWLLVAGALLLAVGGFVNSFSAVERALEPSFGELAWTIPVLIDCGIAVFAGIDLLFTRLDMRIWWLRLIPWSLNGATIWLNVAHENTSVGVVAHAAAPILWIVTVELAGHFLRSQTGLAHDPQRRRQRGRMDRIRVSRWLLAPWSTLVIRRWMILQEERSFVAVYQRWWARKEVKWELQNTYGVIAWRYKAPRELRGRYRYGHLTEHRLDEDNMLVDDSGHGNEAATDRPSELPIPELAEGSATPVTATSPATRTAAPPSRRTRPHRPREPGVSRRASLDDVRRMVLRLQELAQPVNRTVVTQLIRAEGLSLSNERADRLLADLETAPDGDQERPAA